MRKLCCLLALGAALIMSNTAQAGYHHVAYPVVKVVTPKASPPVRHHGHHGKFLCFNPGGIVVCTVAVLIVIDEIKRTVDGPACATNKMTRKSWFGTVRDEPKLWRPLCNWKDPVMVASGQKLWPNGK